LGRGCYIGAGAIILHSISIGEEAIIGAGSVVTRDVPAHTTVVGVPAKIIAQRTSSLSDELSGHHVFQKEE
jgi:maltose O-acetyltransferase